MLSFQADRFEQVVLGQMEGCEEKKMRREGTGEEVGVTHLGVLELLLDVRYDTVAHQAGESAVSQLGSDFTRAGYGSADSAELANLLRAEVADTLDEGEVVEGDVELADGETGSGGGSDMRVGVEIVGSVLLHEVLEGATEVGEEAVAQGRG